MTDTRQHHGAALGLPFDPGAHIQKRRPCGAHFGRPGQLIGHIAAFAKGIGGMGQPFDRAQLIAQKAECDQGHQDAQHQHQHQQLMRVRCRHPGTVKPDLGDPLWQLHPHLDPALIVQIDRLHSVQGVAQGADHHRSGQIIKLVAIPLRAVRREQIHRQFQRLPQ